MRRQGVHIVVFRQSGANYTRRRPSVKQFSGRECCDGSEVAHVCTEVSVHFLLKLQRWINLVQQFTKEALNALQCEFAAGFKAQQQGWRGI